MTSRIFCAIDTPDPARAAALAAALAPHVAGVKFGLEFFCAQGPHGVRAALPSGAPLFLDLKLHDIPNTVAHALTSVLSLQPAFITVHASGGPAMLHAAAESAAQAGATRPKLLAVTVLTSLGADDLAAVGQCTDPATQVLQLARLAQAQGIDGIVCSPQEVALLRRELGPDFVLMVPGIRPAGSASDDQKRTMTPREALAAGATYLVVGRPLTGAADPAAAARAINAACA